MEDQLVESHTENCTAALSGFMDIYSFPFGWAWIHPLCSTRGGFKHRNSRAGGSETACCVFVHVWFHLLLFKSKQWFGVSRIEHAASAPRLPRLYMVVSCGIWELWALASRNVRQTELCWAQLWLVSLLKQQHNQLREVCAAHPYRVRTSPASQMKALPCGASSSSL